MKKSAQERMQLIQDELNFKKNAEFARELGVEYHFISNVKQGKNEISKYLAEKIVEKFPQIDYEWLISGYGKMLKPQQNQTIKNVKDINGMFGNVKGSGHTITHNDTELVTQLQNLILENEKLIKEIVLDNNRRDDEKFLLLKELYAQTEKSINILENQMDSKDKFIMKQSERMDRQDERIDRLLVVIEKFNEK